MIEICGICFFFKESHGHGPISSRFFPECIFPDHKFEPMEERMIKNNWECMKCDEAIAHSHIADEISRLKSDNRRYRTALEEIKEVTAVVDRKKAEDLIPEIYNFAEEALKGESNG